MSNTAVIESIKERMKELEPLHNEYLTLDQVLAEMRKFTSNGTPPARRVKASPEGAKFRPVQGNKRGETIRAVREVLRNEPDGLKVAEIAERLDKNPSYIYSVTNKMVDRGEAVRKGRKIAIGGTPARRRRPA